MKLYDAGATLILFFIISFAVFGVADAVIDDKPKQEQTNEDN